MNFVDRFIEWTELAESPESYFRWAAISALGAVMRDNIYHEWGVKGRLYPNLFILNVGPPAVGKQMPMRRASELIAAANNTRIIQGSASMQAVIKTMGTYETGGQKGASCILYSEELSSFYVKDQNTNELLTDLSDYHEVWERNLIGWNAKLQKVCMSLLGASNEVLLKGIFDSAAIFGGLLSRTLVNIEKKKRRKDLMIRKANNHSDHEQLLINHLKQVAKLKGPIVFDNTAEDLLQQWYEHWDESSGKTGIEGRMKTHVKKVAMCLALGDSNLELVVRKCHAEEALDLCLGLHKNYAVLTMESGKASTAQPAALILRALSEAKNNRLTDKVILRRFLGELNLEIMGQVVPTLIKAELIQEYMVDNETSYQLTPKALEMYKTVGDK